MKLYYFKDPLGNFGDDLNPWLWNRLLPDLFDDDESEVFVGIGTLLNHRLPTKPIKHIFGSGHGYGEPPTIDGSFVFHAVRGFETAGVLGLDPRYVITDPAVLLRTVYSASATRRPGRIGFMPHCLSSRYYDWATVCREVGLSYIGADWDTDRVLTDISSCEAIVCEAMHGAIAADALRVPWIPVVCYEYISAFKWRDWLSTLGLPYQPARIASLYDVERSDPAGRRLKNAVKRGLRALGAWSDAWTPPPENRTSREQFEMAAEQLRVAARGQQYLSEDGVLASHIERYLGLIDAMNARKRPHRKQSDG
jgi:succinoglycan biosynthesis protein ExoV